MKVFLSTVFWLVVISVLLQYTEFGFSIHNLAILLIMGQIVVYFFILINSFGYRIPSEVVTKNQAIENSDMYKHSKIQQYHSEIITVGYECCGVLDIPMGSFNTQCAVYYNFQNQVYVYIYSALNNFIPVSFYKEIAPKHYLVLSATYNQPPFLIHVDNIDFYAVKGRPKLKYLIENFEKKVEKIDYRTGVETLQEAMTYSDEYGEVVFKCLTDKRYLKPTIDKDGFHAPTLKGIFEVFKTQAFLFNIPMKMRAEKKFKGFFKT